jgi:hypothetical protein
MKPVIWVALLFLAGCKAPAPSYDSLSAAIIDGVITKGRWGYGTIWVYTTNSELSMRFPLPVNSTVFQFMKTTFGIYDIALIRNQLKDGSFLDTTVRSTVANIRYVKSLSAGGDSSSRYRRALHGEPVIDHLILLLNKYGNKCIVSIHRVGQGGEFALLERINNRWQVISVQTEYYE